VKLIELLKREEKKALSLGKEESAVVLYMMHVTGYSATELYIHMNDKVSDEVVNKFETEFKKYLYENKPIQYIIGYQTFYGYDYLVDDRVLIPRFETEELVENVILLYDQYFDGKKVDVCDIGTGSGAIAITLALEEKNMQVTATDISSEALEVAEANNQKYNANVTFLQGDMVEPLYGRKFDIIVSNPPYIPNTEEVESLVKDNEPNIALFGGNDGLKFYRIIIENAAKIAKEKFIMAFEHGYNKNEEIESLILQYFPLATVIHKKDMQGKDRMSFAIVGDFNEVE
jgi:release factor glutamine methyltransferase